MTSNVMDYAQKATEDPSETIRVLLARLRNNKDDTDCCARLAFSISPGTESREKMRQFYLRVDGVPFSAATASAVSALGGIDLLLDVISRTEASTTSTGASLQVGGPQARRVYARTALKLTIAGGGFDAGASS